MNVIQAIRISARKSFTGAARSKPLTRRRFVIFGPIVLCIPILLWGLRGVGATKDGERTDGAGPRQGGSPPVVSDEVLRLLKEAERAARDVNKLSNDHIEVPCAVAKVYANLGLRSDYQRLIDAAAADAIADDKQLGARIEALATIARVCREVHDGAGHASAIAGLRKVIDGRCFVSDACRGNMLLALELARSGDADAYQHSAQQAIAISKRYPQPTRDVPLLMVLAQAAAEARDDEAAWGLIDLIAKDPFAGTNAMLSVAVAQAKGGRDDAAARSTKMIFRDDDAAQACAEVAVAQSINGHTDIGMETARRIAEFQFDRSKLVAARAMIGIANERARVGDAAGYQSCAAEASKTLKDVEVKAEEDLGFPTIVSRTLDLAIAAEAYSAKGDKAGYRKAIADARQLLDKMGFADRVLAYVVRAMVRGGDVKGATDLVVGQSDPRTRVLGYLATAEAISFAPNRK